MTVLRQELSLRQELLGLVSHEALYNVVCVCEDGEVHHNRLSVGLVYPVIRDHDTILLPGVSVSQLSDHITRVLKTRLDEVHEDETLEENEIIEKKTVNNNEVIYSQKIEETQDEPVMNNIHPKKKLSSRTRKNISTPNRSHPEAERRSRNPRCMKCSACKLPDCRKCRFCLDMKKYGGPGVKKQSCELRLKCSGKKIASKTKTSNKRKRHDSSDLDNDDEADKDKEEEEDIQPPETLASDSLKCQHCAFVGKSEHGVKKHTVRYHRTCPTDDQDTPQDNSTHQRKYSEQWYLSSKTPADQH